MIVFCHERGHAIGAVLDWEGVAVQEPEEAVAQGIHHRASSDAGWLVQPVEGVLGLEAEVHGGWTE